MEIYTKPLITSITGLSEDDDDFSVALNYAMSNFSYHGFLDTNSHSVRRTLDGVLEKLSIHSEKCKHYALTVLSAEFLDKPLTSINGGDAYAPGSDIHFGVLNLLMLLSNGPMVHDWVPDVHISRSLLRKIAVDDNNEHSVDTSLPSEDGTSIPDWTKLLNEGVEFDNEESMLNDDDSSLWSCISSSDDSYSGEEVETAATLPHELPESIIGDLSIEDKGKFHLENSRCLRLHDMDTEIACEYASVARRFSIRNRGSNECSINVPEPGKPFDTSILVPDDSTTLASAIAMANVHRSAFGVEPKVITLHEADIVLEILWMLAEGVCGHVFVSTLYDNFSDTLEDFEAAMPAIACDMSLPANVPPAYKVNPFVQVSHLSPLSLQRYLLSFTIWGTHLARLDAFVDSVLPVRVVSSTRQLGTRVAPYKRLGLGVFYRTRTTEALAYAVLMWRAEFTKRLGNLTIVERQKLLRNRDNSGNMGIGGAILTLSAAEVELRPLLQQAVMLSTTIAAALERGSWVLAEEEENGCARSVAGILTVLCDTMKVEIFSPEWGDVSLNSRILQEISSAAMKPYLTMIELWVSRGELDDPTGEFFIYRNECKKKDDSDNLKDHLKASPYNNVENVDQVEAWSIFSLRCKSSYTADVTRTDYGYVYDETVVPSFLLPLLDIILCTGKSVRMVRHLHLTTGCPLPESETIRLTGFNNRGISKDDASSDENALSLSSIVEKDLRSSISAMPTDLVIRKRVSMRVRHQYDVFAGFLVEQLENRFNLSQHLANVRAFLFTEAGHVIHHFLAHLFPRVRAHQPWQDTHILNSMMNEALAIYRADVIGRLHVTLDSSKLPTLSRSGQRSQPIHLLDAITFDYIVPEPLTEVIGEASMRQYNRVLTLLLQVKRAKWSLDRIRIKPLMRSTTGQSIMASSESAIALAIAFADYEGDEEKKNRRNVIDKGDSQKRPTVRDGEIAARHLLHWLVLVRGELLHFVNNLHAYMMNRILHGAAKDLADSVTDASDLDALIVAHKKFVDTVCDRCLLHPRQAMVLEAVVKVLNMLLEFSSRWDALLATHFAPLMVTNTSASTRRSHYDDTYTTYGDDEDLTRRLPTQPIEKLISDFRRIEAEFRKCYRFLASLLQAIVRRGTFPHLEALWISLSFSTPQVSTTVAA